MLKKLRFKIVAVTMAIVLAMLIIIFGLIYYFTQSNLQDRADAAMDTVSAAAQQYNYPAAPRPQVDLPYFVLQINIWGDVIASGNTYYDLEDQQLVQELIQNVYRTNQRDGYLPDWNLQFRLHNGHTTQTICFVDLSVQRSTLSALVRNCLLTGALSLLVFFALAVLLARWAVRPVDRAWQQQKQFVSDASHELKTPLTVILSNAELIGEEEGLSEDGRQFAKNILFMSKKMRNLTEGLLELSRADNGQVKQHFAPLDFSRLVAEAVLPFEPAFYEQGMALQWHIEEGIRCNGNEQYLRQVVDILLDNARKYSAPGTVYLELKRQNRQCLLSLFNPGDPIVQEELERIFDRFYRSDRARSQSGSFGLGLSIAKSVVTEHEGRIWAQSNQNGNLFCVSIPVI